jgi:hypothetical protein
LIANLPIRRVKETIAELDNSEKSESNTEVNKS